MGLSDCRECWNTPCCCGWGYRNWSLKRLEEQINLLSKVLAYKQTHLDANFSKWASDEDTPEDKEFETYMKEHK
jgi:hypothetical protein